MRKPNSTGLPPAQGLYRPGVRARQLRRRLRRAHQGQTQPQDHRGRRSLPVPHGPSRRARRRAEHRRRRRNGHGIAARVPGASREGSVLDDVARARQIRRRHRVPAARTLRSASAARRPSPRSAPRRARSSSAGAWCRPTPMRRTIGHGARAAAPHIEQLFVAAGDGFEGEAFERKLYLLRKRASHQLRGDTTLAAGEAVLCLQPVDEGDHLQRHADAGPAAELLSGPACAGLHDASGDGAFALLDEHVPELGPRAAEPLHVAQRRDQHAARQRELDARARKASSRARCSATT